MTWDIADLPWLPRAPEDLKARCEALLAADGPAGTAVRALAATALGGPAQDRLARVIGQLRGRLAPLAPLRLGVLANCTLDPAVSALVVAAARHGVALDVTIGPYDQAVQVATDPGHPFHATRPDVVLLVLHPAGLALETPVGDAAAAEGAVERALGLVEAVRAGIRRASGATLLVQTVPPPPDPLLGHLDAATPGTLRYAIDRLNERLRAPDPSTLVLDAAALAASVGLDRWHDPRDWHWAKLPLARRLMPLWADHVGRLLGALRGKGRRVLALDLDNTLWGGVIGDDGLEGIVLGQGNAAGEAFLDVQRTALRLRERGIVLAVCSKNQDDVARGPFRRHPEMRLREEHISVFQANWTDKATNLRAISEALSLGLESFVFLDDNPVERAQVRRELPEVAVPELPDDPAWYARTLLAAGYFETTSFTQADRDRADQYAQNARRLELAREIGDPASFLRSLDMVARVAPFDREGRARIAQLINKTNQFNVTTRRYTEAEVAAFEGDPSVWTLQVRLADRLGDNGMVSVAIARREPPVWRVDSWLMSCRVLGRRLEDLVLDRMVEAARAEGVTAILGEYRPTQRNEMVRDLFARLGFQRVDEDAERTLWRLDVTTWRPLQPPIVVEDGT
jgi:FkbH-like protein